MARDLPNILLIQADQLKPRVLPGYGGPAAVPHIERLCGEGVVFENAYCNFPLCAPSRFSMLAGMLPSRVRAFDNAAEFAAATPTMAHYLRLAGYRTALAGKQHFVGPDMLPLCGDAATAWDRLVFAEMTSEGVPSPMFMVRSGRFKLMTGGGAPDLLFDLAADPEERHDLAADPDSAEMLAALRRLTEETWDAAALEAEVRASQRERRLVQAAHGNGPAPVWDALGSDPVRASYLRAPDDYNDWAWRGIEPSAP